MFGEGGGERLAVMKKVPYLGSVPLDPNIRIGGDSGRPVVIASPDSDAAKRITEIAKQVAARVSVLNFQQNNVIPISIIG